MTNNKQNCSNNKIRILKYDFSFQTTNGGEVNGK